MRSISSVHGQGDVVGHRVERGELLCEEELLELLPPRGQIGQLVRGGDVEEGKEELAPQLSVPPSGNKEI